IVAMGFGLPAVIGVNASYSAAAGASILAGAGALAVSMRQQKAPPTGQTSGTFTPAARVGRLRLVAAGTGALGLGLEVLWTRLFAQVLHNSVYSFTAIALVFLVALALGAGIAALLLRHVAPAPVAAVALVTAAV